MKVRDVRDWLGLYFLVVTIVIGGYLMIAADSDGLPMRPEEASACLQIVLPLFVGQLTVMFKAFTLAKAKGLESEIDIPIWTVKAPPLLVLALIGVGVVALIASNRENAVLHFGPSGFRGLLTFCVSVLNATTVFVIIKFFQPSTDGVRSQEARSKVAEGKRAKSQATNRSIEFDPARSHPPRDVNTGIVDESSGLSSDPKLGE